MFNLVVVSTFKIVGREGYFGVVCRSPDGLKDNEIPTLLGQQVTLDGKGIVNIEAFERFMCNPPKYILNDHISIMVKGANLLGSTE